MFVRKKRNRSGSISVVVVDKSRGRFREVRQFGVVHTNAEADALCLQARDWIRRYGGQQTIDFEGEACASENDVDRLVSRIDGVSINGTQLILNHIYDSIGFSCIKDDILRHLVVARICQPSSKLATTSYLRSYFKEDIDLSRIYRSPLRNIKIVNYALCIMNYFVSLHTNNLQKWIYEHNQTSLFDAGGDARCRHFPVWMRRKH